MQLSRDELLRAYRQMKVIREFEERLHVDIQTGEIAGFTHLYCGQEAVAVGVCEHLSTDDKIVSTHRGHGHCLAKGCDVDGMMAEIWGSRDGLCKGKGGSMHIADIDAVDADVMDAIENAVTKAKAAPRPKPEDVLEDVYISY